MSDTEARNTARDTWRRTNSVRRARVVAAARDVFAAKGYRATSMDEIAERADVSKPVLYQHFPGKLELYLDILETHVAELVTRVAEAVETPFAYQGWVRRVVSAHFDFVDGDDTRRLVLESDVAGEQSVRSVVDRGREDCVRVIAEAVLVEVGLEETAEQIATLLVDVSRSAARSWQANDRVPSKREAVNGTAALVWTGVSGHLRDPADLPVPGIVRYHDDGEDVLPVSIYLDSARNASAVEHAVLDVLYTFGLTIEDAAPPVVGSWFRSMRARPDAGRDVADVLNRIERSIEMQALHKPQAEIDAAQADAVAKLITALGADPNAFVQIGSVLLVKVDGVVVVRNLTQRELVFLQRNSGLLVSPKAILEALETFAVNDGPPRCEPAGDRPKVPRVAAERE